MLPQMIYGAFGSVATWGGVGFRSILSLPAAILKKIFEVANPIFSFFGYKKKPVDLDKEPFPDTPAIEKASNEFFPSAPLASNLLVVEQFEPEFAPTAPPAPVADSSVLQAAFTEVERLAILCIATPSNKSALLELIDDYAAAVSKDDLISFAITVLLKNSPDPAVIRHPSALAGDLVDRLAFSENKKAKLGEIMLFYVEHSYIDGQQRVADALKAQPEPQKNDLIRIFLEHNQFEEYRALGLNSEENMIAACEYDGKFVSKLLNYMEDASILEFMQKYSGEFALVKARLSVQNMNEAFNAIHTLIDFDINEEQKKRLIRIIRDELVKEFFEDKSLQDAFITRCNQRFGTV